MATVTELAISRGGQGSSGGKEQAARLFRVVREAADPAVTAFNPLQAAGLPVSGTPHPSVTNTVLDELVVTGRHPPDAWLVEARYSNAGLFRLPGRVQDDLPSFASWEFDSIRVPDTYPVYRRRIVTQAITIIGGTVRAVLWDRDTASRSSGVELRARRRVNVQVFGPLERDQIVFNTNKYHQFGNIGPSPIVWRFMGGQAFQRDDARWEIQYEWVTDQGSPGLGLPVDHTGAAIGVTDYWRAFDSNTDTIIAGRRPAWHEYSQREGVPVGPPGGGPPERGIWPQIILVPVIESQDIIPAANVTLPGDPLQ